jgi:hypothetical protein
MSSISLDDGEYFIWSSPRSGTTRITPRQLVGIFFIGFYLLGGVITLCVFTGWPGLVGSMALFAGIVALVRWHRRRPAFFMTNKHLIDAGIIFKQKIPLVSIQGCERYVQEMYTRYGVERIMTDKMVILSAGQSVMFGPVFDFDGLWELIHHAVLRDTIQISALPSLEGGLAPVEQRNDILFLLSTTTEGDVYGPLFIGPTKIIRFTEKLPSFLERMLLTVGAAQNTPDEMEHHLLQLVKHPQAGHSITLERGLTAASVQGNTLTLTASERVVTMELRPADVTRTSAFVRMWRPAHPMR